jgi:hypothetical protein
MVAACNLCPTGSNGIVWFKWANESYWRYYKPLAFPFSFVIDPIGGGQYRLKFLKPELGGRAFQINFTYDRYTSGSIAYIGTYFASVRWTDIAGGYFFGNSNSGNDIQIGLGDDGRFWRVSGKDQCGNFTLKTSIRDGISPTSYTLYNADYTALANPAFTYRARNIQVNSFIYHSTLRANCPGCPHPWDTKLKEFTGVGSPQISMSCNGDSCPPNTDCECDCQPGYKCCYDANGNPLYIAQI